MAVHRISKRGLDFIKGFESFVPYVYDDLLAPVGGKYREWDGGHVQGTLTIGYGHTNSAKHPLKIRQGLRITEAKGREILDVDLDELEDAVNRYVKPPITQGQFDALTSFGFNAGTGALRKLIIPLNEGDPDGTRRKFDLYVRSKGKVLRGLQRRRAGEQQMWDQVEEGETPIATEPETGPRVDEPPDVPVPVPAPDEPVLSPKGVEAPPTPTVIKTTTGQGAAVGIFASFMAFLSTIWDSIKELPYSIERFLSALLTDMSSKPAFWFALLAGGAGAFVIWRRSKKIETEGRR